MHSAIVALLVAAGVGSTPVASSPPPTLPEKLDPVIDRALAQERIVGTVVVVVQDGKVVYRRAAGRSDREEAKPMREDAVFRLASMTKPLVSVAALALVDQGTLSLEDPVTKWLPDFRPRLADGREPVITVRHLLTHTSGLTYGFKETTVDGPYRRAGVSDGMDATPGLTLEENLRRIASVPLSNEPGTAFNYSVSTDVLGAVVAKAGGASLPEVVSRLVTGPLGLRDTGFTVGDVSRLATPYADGKPRPVRMGEAQEVPLWGGVVHFAPGRALDPTAFPSGGAGMVGTAEDYVKLLETVRLGGAPVLKAATTRQLVEDGFAAKKLQGSAPGWGWGLGSSVLVDPVKARTPQSVGTLQWGGAYGHNWFVDPKQRLTVVALTNTAFEGMSGAFVTEVRDAIYAGLGKAPSVKAPATKARAKGTERGVAQPRP
ncbi:beta-lactamase family protein [Myxococcus sp. K15C18031901]|uniref:serine hydrolase domain-containing protein n=1 Tax=Myxococcus dinghuensis TaxID=2906761 RepID=UPI0020A7A832|nr:serine hydrolase domain-containing protein [Myxococcus dinghuensis]MCP3099734.1 beta-lactamase family protein [Myxococcus dinghuensis]